MPKTSNYKMQADMSEKTMRKMREVMESMGARPVGPDCFIMDSPDPDAVLKKAYEAGMKDFMGVPHTEAVKQPSQKELARRALKGLAVSKAAVEAAQASYQCDPEYGLTDADMRLAIMAALREMTKCPRRK